MRRKIGLLLGAVVTVGASLVIGANGAQAAGDGAWVGPYKSRSTCEAKRTSYPWVVGWDGSAGYDVNRDGLPDQVSPCYKLSDGKYYFYWSDGY